MRNTAPLRNSILRPTTQEGKLARFLSYPDSKQAALPISYNIDGAA